MARPVPNRPLARDVHARALADADRDGREATATRYGVSRATLERALAWAPLSPLARRAIENAVRGASTNPEGRAA